MSLQPRISYSHRHSTISTCIQVAVLLITIGGIQQCQSFIVTTITTTQLTTRPFGSNKNKNNHRIRPRHHPISIDPNQRWSSTPYKELFGTTQNNNNNYKNRQQLTLLKTKYTRQELRSSTFLLFSRKNNDNDHNDHETTEHDNSNSDNVLNRISTIITSDISRSFQFSLLMILSGAVLGPFLDSYHSAFGVLQYNTPITAQLWSLSDDDIPALITSWWVPPLFGVAGFIIGWLYIILDGILVDPKTTADNNNNNNNNNTNPSPPIILVGIALFTFQYWLSGVFYSYGVDRTTILNIMSIVAATGFVVLDRTMTGFITSTATAIGGPLIELGLITYFAAATPNNPSGYQYTDLGETGYFPLWIIPVYFLGGPAVGNLARGIWNTLVLLSSSSSLSSLSDFSPRNDNNHTKVSPPGCTECNDTRIVPCPNCDGIGTYVAMGGRRIPCTSCRGRGYVICRICFSYYDDDPYDIESIREIVSKMPD